MTMRIAYNTGEYPRATDTFIQREVAALRSLGVDVITCSIRRTAAEHHVGPEQLDEAAKTFYVIQAAKSPWRLLTSHLGELIRSPVRYLASLRLALELGWPGIKGRLRSLAYFVEAGVLANELRTRQVQHVHNHFANSSCSVAAIATTMCGIGLSITMHGPAIFFEPAKWHIGRKVGLAKFVSCISDFCRSQAMIFTKVRDWEKMNIVHCGVDSGLFEKRVHSELATQVLWVGRLAAVKGLPILLDAWARVSKEYRDVRLKLVGDGPDRAMIERRIKELGLEDRITITGYLSQSDVRTELQRSDLFVMPSFAEGVPVVLMEAMAAGIPVVATRIAGVGELREDGKHGLLEPPGNTDALAGAILRLLGDRTLRQEFGDLGRVKVESDYNGLREAEKLRELFSLSETNRH